MMITYAIVAALGQRLAELEGLGLDAEEVMICHLTNASLNSLLKETKRANHA